MDRFIPWSKVDAATRTVYVQVGEELDYKREIMDYEKSKPHILDWSKKVADASDGKSYGNVRAMHDDTHAAGKVTAITPLDNLKKFDLAIQVVDDNDWNKVIEGVYTGTSWGGRYGEKWYDPVEKAIRYVGIPSEISLVDLPCNPGAKFRMTKADGSEEELEFKKVLTADQVADRDVPIELPVTNTDEPMTKTAFTLKWEELEKAREEVLSKRDTALQEKVMAAVQDALKKSDEAEAKVVEELRQRAADLETRLKKMEEAPAPGGPVVRTTENRGEDKTPNETRYQTLDRLAKSATDPATRVSLEKAAQLEMMKEHLAQQP